VLMVPASLSARDVTRSDLTRKSPFGGQVSQSFSAEQKRFEVNQNISGKRFPVTEWHGRFNNIGRQRASIDMTPRERDMLSYETLSFDTRELSMSRYDGRQAYVRNQGNIERAMDARVADDVPVRRFDGPMKEILSELDVDDQVTMEDLNRFFYMRNKPGVSDTGEIPVNRAGSAE